MGGAAGPGAAVNYGRIWGDKKKSGSGDEVPTDLHDAWRLAFVVVADAELATRAVSKAVFGHSSGEPGDPVTLPEPLDLLEATLRISLTRAAENPDRDSESAVTTALWQLPPQQRAALWLAKVNEFDNVALGTLLGLTPVNASHVAARAAEWLDVALDQESGPLCSHEVELDDFMHDQLPPDEAAEMRAHLPTCPTCRTKMRAFDELDDLKAVLTRAVPKPPAGLTMATLEQQQRPEPSSTPANLDEPVRRTPAVRPLVACCIALFVMGLIGIKVVGPARASSDPPPASGDPSAIVPGSSGNGAGSVANLPTGTATTVTVTTTSLPAVTFPTIPAATARRRK